VGREREREGDEGEEGERGKKKRKKKLKKNNRRIISIGKFTFGIKTKFN
jgi:hypothetical protein